MRIFVALGFVLALFLGITCHMLVQLHRADDRPLWGEDTWLPLSTPAAAMPQLFSPAEQNWILEHPVVNVSLSPAFFSTEDQGSVDAYTAVSLDFLRILGGISGLRFRTVPLSNWQDPLDEAARGAVDVFAVAERGQRTEGLFVFTPSYVPLAGVVVSRKDGPAQTLSSLRNQKVATRPGHFWASYLAEHYPHIQQIPTSSLQHGLMLVAGGKADALVGYQFSVERRLRNNPNLALKVTEVLPDISGLSMAVRANLPQLASILGKSLEHISALQKQAIYKRWLEESARWGVYSRQFWYALLAVQLVGAALLLVLFWNYQLRRKVEERTQSLAQELQRSAHASALESLNADLRRAMCEAESAREVKDRFLANISHEVRTPLHGIIAFTELAYGKKQPLPRRHQRTILDLAHNLLDLVNDILDFSRIEAEALRVEHAPFVLDDVVRRVCDMTVHTPRARDLECVVDLHPGAPAALVGDAGKVQQVLANLMSNAVKFTPAGGRVHMRITGEALHGKAHLRFMIQDTGVGIAPADLKQLFRPFGQVDSSLTRAHGGTGLGLSIARHLVEKLGGEIWVESEPGEGSTFAFGLCMDMQEAPAQPSAPPYGGLKAVVAGASELGAQVLRQQLEALGMRVHCLPSPAQPGIQNLPFVPDMLVVDRMHGEEAQDAALHLVQRLHEHWGSCVPALLLGGPLEELAVADAALPLRLEVARVATPDCLRAALRALLGNAAQHKGLSAAHASQPTPTLTGAQLLVVEDNAVNREVMSALFENTGAELTMAAHGREALDLLAQRKFDLMFLDIQMPELDGYATIRLARERGHRLPVVGITAHAMHGDRQRCLDAGMDAYLSKPFRQNQLFETLRRLAPHCFKMERVRLTLPLTPPAPPPAPLSALSSAQLPAALTSPPPMLDAPYAPFPEESPALWQPPACFSLPALHSAGLSRQGFHQALRSFVRHHGEDVPLLRQYAATGDGPALLSLRRLAHTLKGTGANLGALALRDAAAALEKALPAQPPAHSPAPPAPPVLAAAPASPVPLLVEGLIAALHTVLTEAALELRHAPLHGAEPQADAPLPAPHDLPLLRTALAEALRTAQPARIGELLARLPRHGSAAYSAARQQLAAQVADYDYDAALLTLELLPADPSQESADHVC